MRTSRPRSSASPLTVLASLLLYSSLTDVHVACQSVIGDEVETVQTRASGNSIDSIQYDFVMRQLVTQNVQLERLREELERQKLESQRQNAVTASQLEKLKSGATYVRWGRSTCDGNAEILYRGHTAGPHFLQTGSGSNLLCLHESPQWDQQLTGNQEPMSRIYGVEYQFFAGERGLNNNVFSFANNGGRTVSDKPAACCVCYTPSRATNVVIPARTECPTGWTKEFAGYIVAGHHARPGRFDYVCWDRAPEVASGATSQAQGFIYATEVMCGSLPCSKYTDGMELTCVVCSK